MKSWLVVRGEMGKRTRMRAGVGRCGVVARGVCVWSEAIWWARAGAYKRADVGGAYGVVVSGIAAGRKDVCVWAIIRNPFGMLLYLSY